MFIKFTVVCDNFDGKELMQTQSPYVVIINSERVVKCAQPSGQDYTIIYLTDGTKYGVNQTYDEVFDLLNPSS